MANWLGRTVSQVVGSFRCSPNALDTLDKERIDILQGGVEEAVTSSDFERFLAERAAAADSLPTVTATTGSTNPSTLKKDTKKKEEDLLAL